MIKIAHSRYLKREIYCVCIRNTFVNLFHLCVDYFYKMRNIRVCIEKYFCTDTHLYLNSEIHLLSLHFIHFKAILSSVIKSVSWQILSLCHHKAQTWKPYIFMSLCSVHIRSCDGRRPRQHSYWWDRSLQKWEWLLSSWERVHLPRLPLWSATPTINKPHLGPAERRVQTGRLFRPHHRSYSGDRSRFALRFNPSLLICTTFFKFICKPHNGHKFICIILNICLIRSLRAVEVWMSIQAHWAELREF